jgi:vacuolar-type H+-ATPase subunit D/Vma8
MAEVEVETEVDNELLKELIETGKKIQKELDEFNEKLDTLIEAVTVEEIVNWID